MVLFFFIKSTAQFLNRDVKAIIEVTPSEKLFKIVAKAENISKISYSLLYELKVIKEDDSSGNVADNKQSGRFVIESGDVKKLAFSAINGTNGKEKIILLLLLRNLENDIIGKARVVISENKILNSDYDNKITLDIKPKDGVKLTGVVLEKTKTKPGRDFYSFFYSQFLTYNFKDSRTVMVEEVFSRGRTTKIHIKVDNVKVYEFFLQPNTDFLKTNAQKAVKIIYVYFNKKKKDYIVRY
jgi:hypothetical protein